MGLFKSKKKKIDNYSLKHGVGLVTYNDPMSTVSEQFKTIRTNIQFSSVDKKLKSILFTSSARSEGKSTVSNNMAVTQAKQGDRVLLIDADLRRPIMHKTFNLNNGYGLSNYLSGNARLEDIVQRTMIDNLFVITSGPIPPNPSELLGSVRTQQLLDSLSQQFDLLILDAPPVNAVTDSQVLGSMVDGVILVIPQGIAKKSGVARAKQLLETVHANILGFVMNRVSETSSSKYGGYYGAYKK
ncbi:CpsD/CapB family tyrosine-protein kinase [Companilactobacillus furfuricola]|uniref:CpsD/CapB family tyrosine-protein kinase n=1 Tax=Companilactobacillus furfuricola TaxID=1462575 RepID=UPI000F775921|nr:CpsD/CapB family tyrosine-protein kinase [Companilactobacillus furfuricola]